MKKKIMIFIAILVLFLIGSFASMVSSTSTEEEVNESCLDDCKNYDSKCNDSNNCNSQGNKICDGLGSCSQNKDPQGYCKTDSSCSGSCHK
ncbi:hypothetical protein AYK21_06405 [Thermoplasmatales archaeon SG8-52-2]|nr:MAG: hypothetical protein AYK21_06405 [Thermoplasmatales archaeon SG8-52-2]